MRNASFVSPIRLRHLLWVPIVAGIVGAAWHFGTPHLRLRYVWNGNTAAPAYYRCEYWGLHPFNVAHPFGGDCPVLLLAGAAS